MKLPSGVVAWSYAVLGTAIAAAAALADPSFSPKIAEISAQIAKDPRNTDLYLKRAELHRRRGDVESALADLEFAAELPGAAVEAHHRSAQILHDVRRYDGALEKLGLALAAQADHAPSRRLRARCLSALGRHADAVKAYRGLHQQGTGHDPDHYAEFAAATAAQGRKHLPEAIRVLDDGIAALGPIVSLVLPALDYELGLERWDAALARLDRLLATTPRKDPWLKKRGEILLRAKRPREAREAFALALAELEKLPPAVRATPASRETEKELRALAAGKPPRSGAARESISRRRSSGK